MMNAPEHFGQDTSATPEAAAQPSRVRRDARALWQELRVFRRDFVLALILTGLGAAVSLMLPWRMQIIVGDVLPAPTFGRILQELGILLVVALSAFALVAIRRIITERLCFRLTARKRAELFRHMLAIPPRSIQKAEGGQFLSVMTNDLQINLDATRVLITTIIPSILLVVVYLGALLWFSWQLTVFLALVAVPLVVATNHFARRIHEAAHVAQKRFGNLLGDLAETLGGTREIKLFGMETRMQRQFEIDNARLLEGDVRREVLATLHPFSVSVVAAFGVAAIVVFSVVLVNQGVIDIRNLTAFVVTIALVYPLLQEASHALGKLAQLSAARDRIAAVLAIPPERDVAASGGALPADASVRLRGVNFRHDPESFALRDIDLDVGPGEKLAIVGPSGAGKSTLIELLARFNEPQSGQILLGGVPIKAMSLAHLRRHVGMVPQVPFVFRASLLDNLRAGRPGASHEAVLKAAHEARVDEFARNLPQGYDTMIEPGGSNLSVGQRQRIAIARVLLKDPAVLLLDEPTSALDAASERHVTDALSSAARNRTTIIVAHRLSTLREVDRIVVMQEGRIVEQGSPAALLAQGGLYADLYRQSMGGAPL